MITKTRVVKLENPEGRIFLHSCVNLWAGCISWDDCALLTTLHLHTSDWIYGLSSGFCDRCGKWKPAFHSCSCKTYVFLSRGSTGGEGLVLSCICLKLEAWQLCGCFFCCVSWGELSAGPRSINVDTLLLSFWLVLCHSTFLLPMSGCNQASSPSDDLEADGDDWFCSNRQQQILLATSRLFVRFVMLFLLLFFGWNFCRLIFLAISFHFVIKTIKLACRKINCLSCM